MKKLLVLLVLTLVIGSVFSGPVHINGPGILTRDTVIFLPSEETISADAILLMTGGIVANNLCRIDRFEIFRYFEVGGTVAVDSQGFYNDGFSGVSDLPTMFSAILTVSPDSTKFVFGDNCQSQEVISLRGSSKPACTVKNDIS
jgi:hypothetical protein